MARKSADDLYREGRSYPRGQVREHHPAPPRAADFHRHEEIQENQMFEDAHDNRGGYYDNDHRDDWVRGRNEDATSKPGFDKSNPVEERKITNGQ